MRFKWIATAALAVALIPAVASAQAKTAKDSAAKDSAAKKSTPRDTVTATSTGEVSAPTSNVPEAALKAREDPNLIGSPAWWRNHATADGKPISAQTRKTP
jgi:hypothetical protein